MLCAPWFGSCTTLVSIYSPPNAIGTVQGVVASVGQLGSMMAPPLAGLLYDKYGLLTSWCIGDLDARP